MDVNKAAASLPSLSLVLPSIMVGRKITLPLEIGDLGDLSPFALNCGENAFLGQKEGVVRLSYNGNEYDVPIISDPFLEKSKAYKKRLEEGLKEKEGLTLFMGSSTFDTEFFSTFFSLYKGKNVGNVAISGSTSRQWFHYVGDLVIPYKPKNVCIYVGTNDVNGDMVSPEAILQRLIALFEKLHVKLPDTKVYYLGIFPSFAFPQNYQKAAKINKGVASFANENPYLTFVKVPSWLKGEDDKALSPELFRDGLHLKVENYEGIVLALKEAGLEV